MPINVFIELVKRIKKAKKNALMLKNNLIVFVSFSQKRNLFKVQIATVNVMYILVYDFLYLIFLKVLLNEVLIA